MSRKSIILVLILLVLLIFGFYDKYNFKIKPPSAQESSIFSKSSMESCPEEIDIEYFYAMKRFPYPLEPYVPDETKGKGDINSYCEKGSREGQNTNYAYCGYFMSPFQSFTYVQDNVVDGQGIIREGKSYDLKIIYDLESCEQYGTDVVGLFKCKIVEITCKEL
jgi:hypothetical protein